MSETLSSRWINLCIADGNDKHVFLKNGIRLVGRLLEHDAEAILMCNSRTGSETLVYKDTVSTIVRNPDK